MKSHKLHCKFSKQNQIHKNNHTNPTKTLTTHHSSPSPSHLPVSLVSLVSPVSPVSLVSPRNDRNDRNTETSDTGIDKSLAHLSNMMSQLFRVKITNLQMDPIPMEVYRM